MIEKLLNTYPHSEWTYKPNKCLIPKVFLEMYMIDKFNDIYKWCHENLVEVLPTDSGGIPYNNQVRNVERFCVCTDNKTGFELVILTIKGCFRFILRNGKLKEDNTISGYKALKTIYETADKFGVLDTFKNNAVNKEDGLKIKKQIESPIIKTVKEEYKCKEFDNCHHIDFNSSYASRIVEKYKELKPMYEYLYENRKEDNGYFKHCLTNSIGKMQSKTCVDVDTKYKTSPYQLSEFAKIAVNGTNDKIYEYLMLLQLSGRKPLLVNTDGIWYQGEIYHDKYEGLGLCQWKNDHKNCKLYIKSDGAYQFIEKGIVNSVVRGYTQLDSIKPREFWEWREIDKYEAVCFYEFEFGKGVIKKWVDVM
jgi:hypothetical protein